MDKFSIIIPTLWKSPLTISLLENLNRCDLVDEIILIENVSLGLRLSYFSKLIRITPPDNLFVNPSWNLGVRIAKNNLVCVCNDDILFTPEPLLEFVSEKSNLMGCFGVNPESYTTFLQVPEIQTGYCEGKGWGTLMFFKKTDYIPIPTNLKIWYGDDWIVKNIKPTYNLTYSIQTQMSTTSGLPEFRSVINNDTKEWRKI